MTRRSLHAPYYCLPHFPWIALQSNRPRCDLGQVHGVVHDPQHRPIAGVHIELHAATSAFTKTAVTGQDGSFPFRRFRSATMSLRCLKPASSVSAKLSRSPRIPHPSCTSNYNSELCSKP
ncbi:carboxypeptidase-like regulatory domain-containing protein [Edaphobacter modestus]|uniref:carboxypeptidase-like regulatory domain-containing protein n=1 Tax=Edaphobacter modestus TaxID=388466 RepID=UPI003BF83EE6